MKRNLLYLLLSLPLFISAQSSWNMNLLGSFDYETNHNTKCNDIWGWEDGSGNEYALVGLENGFSCVDVTNPSSPVEEFFISDINSTWRDIKTWGNYAYITTEANAGLLIVDLTDLTGNTYWHVSQFTNPTTGANISFTSAHNIYIDENGIAYIFAPKNNGTSVANRGVVFLDVNANATSPIYLGEWTGEYIHDGMARGDTMYAGCIYAGELFVVDVSNKSNPQTLGSQTTPNAFTHNAWVSDNGNYIFTTDEQSDAYLAAYDISDVNNIQEVDRIQSNPGSNSIPHNTHVDGNFLITSYYRDGTTVHDITYPNHMIQVAYYDSYAGSGNGFDGCWGTYPFLSSGNIISSDRNSNNGKGILNIYGRAFQQACYLMGNVVDGISGNNLASVSVTILNTTTSAQANIVGDYQTAVIDSGTYQVVFSTIGYISDTLSVLLDNGIMTILDAQLYPIGSGCTDPLANNYNALATINDSSCIYQMTFVPDDNFENYLESNGMGNGIINDDSVLTANINSQNVLYIFNLNIADLTGIEDFSMLGTLNCAHNQLTSLDVSQNTNLNTLYCDLNQLTSLDVSNNTALGYLTCAHNQLTSLDVSGATALWGVSCNINQLTSLDVSQNTALSTLECSYNQLTSLDVSQNTALTDIGCAGNQLSTLNVRNGNNLNFTYFYSLYNTNLFCIDVDDAIYSTANWTNIDTWTNFSSNCATAFGCTDSLACNYDSTATIDDGSCIMPDGCTSPLACNYDSSALCDDGSCVYPIVWQQTFLICDGDSVVVGSSVYDTTGVYTDTLNTANGCDSIVYTNISITPPIIWQQAFSICDGDSVVVGSNVYNTAGNYTDTLNASNGCDSIAYTNISITLPIIWQQAFSICNGDSVVVGSSVYNTAGNYTDTLNASNGCDSILYTNLVIDQNTSSYDTLSVTVNMVWNGMTLTVSGDYSIILVNSAGCDSIANLNLTILPSGVKDLSGNQSKTVLRIINVLGEPTKPTSNTPLFYIYDDGTVEKRITVE